MGFSPITGGGYPLSDAVSALQKMVRRGDEKKALYWALELESKFHLYLWHRLEVIANEDVGLANPDMVVLVATLKRQYMEMRERSGQASELLPLAHAVLAMCRAKKSRIVDNFMTVVIQERLQHGWREEIPDCAKDKHTAAGKRLGRGWEFFNEESSKLVNESADVEDVYRDRANELRLTYQNLARPGKKGSTDNRKLAAGKKGNPGNPEASEEDLFEDQ